MDDDLDAEEAGSAREGAPSDVAVRRALVQSHGDLVNFLRRRLSDPDEAEEVLQRFMLKAIERSADLRELDSVRGWLGRVLATTIIDHQRTVIRRRMREQATDPDELSKMSDLAVTPDAETDQAVCNCLYKLLPTLKADYAQVIWRADLLDEPRDRIAVSLGTSLNNVTVRLHRARQALKTRLEEMCRTCVVHGFLDCRCEFSFTDR